MGAVVRKVVDLQTDVGKKATKIHPVSQPFLLAAGPYVSHPVLRSNYRA